MRPFRSYDFPLGDMRPEDLWIKAREAEIDFAYYHGDGECESAEVLYALTRDLIDIRNLKEFPRAE